MALDGISDLQTVVQELKNTHLVFFADFNSRAVGTNQIKDCLSEVSQRWRFTDHIQRGIVSIYILPVTALSP